MHFDLIQIYFVESDDKSFLPALTFTSSAMLPVVPFSVLTNGLVEREFGSAVFCSCFLKTAKLQHGSLDTGSCRTPRSAVFDV